MFKMEETIKVVVRIKPQRINNNNIKILQTDQPVLILADGRNAFVYDKIFDEAASQSEIYNSIAKPIIIKVLNGYNCSIFAYGQTGTGKTYTMGAEAQTFDDINAGLIPRVMKELIEIGNSSDINISISFLEIYNKKVFDLLQTTKTPLDLKGFTVKNLTILEMTDLKTVEHWLMVGWRNRHVRSTSLNNASSRSHAIFTIYCTKNNSKTAKLHLVDLAGSESVRKTNTRGAAFQEGVSINHGLLTLGRVISSLSTKAPQIIPYRDSVLTRILHDSLTSDNFISLIACVSSNPADATETKETLRFAARVKEIKSRPQLEGIIDEYDKENPGILPPRTLCSTVKKRPKQNTMSYSAIKPKMITHKFTLSPSLSISNINASSVSSSTTINNTNFLNQFSYSRSTENYFSEEKENQTNTLNTIENVSDWPTIKKEIKNVIRSELLDIMDDKVKKRLIFNNSPEFKAPKPPLISSSPIQQLRRSVRLSKAPIPMPRGNSVFMPSSPVKMVRRSTRISMRNMTNQVTVPTPAPRSKITSNMIKHVSPPQAIRKSIRQSIRKAATVHNDELNMPKSKTPKNKISKKVKLEKLRKDTLIILNKGTIKDLQKLIMIGSKSALQIMTYRSLNGSFCNLEDLKNIPTWTDAKFNKFMFANQLISFNST